MRAVPRDAAGTLATRFIDGQRGPVPTPEENCTTQAQFLASVWPWDWHKAALAAAWEVFHECDRTKFSECVVKSEAEWNGRPL